MREKNYLKGCFLHCLVKLVLSIWDQQRDPDILSEECSLILLFFWEEDQTLGISKVIEMRRKMEQDPELLPYSCL